MTTAPIDPGSKHSVRVTRVIRASRERLFDAWLNPEIRRQWWLTAHGEGPTVCEIDAQVGGRYRLHQIGGGCESPEQDENYEWIMEGEFLEIVPPERLVFTWNVNHVDEPVVDQRVTVEFRAVPGGTEITITHEGILSAAMQAGTDAGWSKLLELLEHSMTAA
jgi:uncharacterized protein YndB with AHSA1/START domain